jgi:hypothetical protein
VVEAIWRIILCLMLFMLANLLKGIAAKLLSVHFYRSVSMSAFLIPTR